MKKRIIKALAAFAAVGILLSGCGGKGGSSAGKGTDSTSSAQEEAVLHLAMKDDLVTLDTQKTSNDYITPMNVFDTLFTINKKADGSTEILNSLAKNYDVSEDGLIYHFTLRDGVVFSDGTPLVADDVLFTFERILTIPDSAQTDFVIAIDGAQELLDGEADSLRGMKVEDDTHFTVTLAEPFAGFIAELAAPSTAIYSRSIVTKAGDDFGVVPEKTIGTGPYIIKEWNRGSGLVFEANPLYWGEKPTAQRVELKVMDPSSMSMAFQKGDLDILDCIYLDSAIVNATFKTPAYKDSLTSVDCLGITFLILNEDIKPLDNVNVRKALQMAIDRQSILDTIFSGDGKLEDGVYPSGCLGYSQENQGWIPYDPIKAAALLEQEGYGKGFTMEIAADSGAADSVMNALQIIAKNLEEVGITVKIKSYDHASWLDLRNSGKMPAFMGTWTLDFNDPDNVIYTFFGSEDNTKIRSINYKDKETIARVGAARAITDEDARMKEYAALEKKLVQEDAVWVPMYSLKHLYLKGSRVESFTPQWAGWSDVYFKDIVLK